MVQSCKAVVGMIHTLRICFTYSPPPTFPLHTHTHTHTYTHTHMHTCMHAHTHLLIPSTLPSLQSPPPFTDSLLQPFPHPFSPSALPSLADLPPNKGVVVVKESEKDTEDSNCRTSTDAVLHTLQDFS